MLRHATQPAALPASWGQAARAASLRSADRSPIAATGGAGGCGAPGRRPAGDACCPACAGSATAGPWPAAAPPCRSGGCSSASPAARHSNTCSPPSLPVSLSVSLSVRGRGWVGTSAHKLQACQPAASRRIVTVLGAPPRGPYLRRARRPIVARRSTPPSRASPPSSPTGRRGATGGAVPRVARCHGRRAPCPGRAQSRGAGQPARDGRRPKGRRGLVELGPRPVTSGHGGRQTRDALPRCPAGVSCAGRRVPRRGTAPRPSCARPVQRCRVRDSATRPAPWCARARAWSAAGRCSTCVHCALLHVCSTPAQGCPNMQQPATDRPGRGPQPTGSHPPACRQGHAAGFSGSGRRTADGAAPVATQRRLRDGSARSSGDLAWSRHI
jgi:hypothetical protein